MHDTLRTLTRATAGAYHELEAESRPRDEIYAGLTAKFAEHGLDANTAESAVDWYDGGADWLVESLMEAINDRDAERLAKHDVHVWGRDRQCKVEGCRIICGLSDPDEWCHQCGAQFTIDENGTAYHVSADTPDGIDHDADADHVAYSLPDEDEDES